METEHTESRSTEGCFDRTCSALTVNDVYEIAKLVGAEVEKLIDGYGKESVEGLVPRIVKVLELLESFASRNHAHKLREEELLKTFETIQLQQQKKRGGKESEEGSDGNETRVRDVGACSSPTPPFCKQYSSVTYGFYSRCIFYMCVCYNNNTAVLSTVITYVLGGILCRDKE